MALYVSLDRRNLDGRCLRTQTPEGSKPKSGPRERSESECPPLHRQTATNTRYCLCPSLSRWPPSRDSLLFPLAGTCDAAYRPPTPSHPCLPPRRIIPNASAGLCGLRPAPPPPSCVCPTPAAEPPPATRSHGNEFLTACPLILPSPARLHTWDGRTRDGSPPRVLRQPSSAQFRERASAPSTFLSGQSRRTALETCRLRPHVGSQVPSLGSHRRILISRQPLSDALNLVSRRSMVVPPPGDLPGGTISCKRPSQLVLRA